MIRKLALVLSTALPITLCATVVGADDTDIYVDNSASAPPSSQPLVMFGVDYRSNLGSTVCAATSRPCNVDTFFLTEGFSASFLPPLDQPITFFDVLRLSLRLVLRETSGYKAGLMLNHNHESNCDGPQSGKKCSNGGYIARRFRSITSVVSPGGTDTDASRIELLGILDSLPPTQGNLSHPYQGTELFFEFFRYLTGLRVHNGTNGWTDYATSIAENLGLRNADGTGTGDNLPVGRDTLAASGGAASERTYGSPLLAADACTKIFSINFLFQVSTQDNDSNGAASAARSSAGLGITVPNATSFPTVIGFLRDVDLAPETNKFNSALSWTFTDQNGNSTTLGHLPGKQNVTSFFIARPTPEPGPNQDDPDVFSFDSTTVGYSVAGGTERPLPLSKDPAKLVNAIRNALQQILSVSTTLVAASVPVNVFNRSEIVDNVYFALFQAQGAGSPEATNVPGGIYYWPGNLKKLKLGTSAGRPEIQDVAGQPAIATLDGRLLSSALSFWTDISGTRLNAGDRNGDGATDSTDSDGDGIGNDFTPPLSGSAANPADFVTKKDGRIIARGGAGQKTPGFTGTGPGDANPSGAAVAAGPRKLFYLSSSVSSASLQPLNSDSTSTEVKTQLGDAAMSNSDATKILRYARGQDVNDTDGDNNGSESRYWIMGDPLHSRPLPINYGLSNGHGSTRNPAIFIAMASNDGYLRMFRNTAATSTDTDTVSELGQELWAFMPPEGMAVQKQLMNQTAPVGFPAHPYSFDGEATALIIDQDGDGTIECNGTCNGASDDDRVVLYVGLRRGGRAYYALDVTDPLNPAFLWRITPTTRTTASGEALTDDFAGMGQTFSRPRIGLVKLGTNPDGSDIRRLAVFFGGGYDGGYAGSVDANGKPERLANDIDGSLANDSIGNSIFIIRANNAQLLWKAIKGTGTATSTVFQHAALNDSIPSNVTTVDSDADGAVDRIYVGDTGGTVWRADLGGDTDTPADGVTDDWKLTVLAKLGRHGGTANRLNDRRFFHEPDVIQSRDATGRFDAVVIGSGDREDPLDQGGDVDNWFYVIKDRNIGIAAGVDSTRTHDSLTDVTNQCLAGSSSCTINAEGWRMALDNDNGEKALSAPVTIANAIFFTTYVPPPPATNTGLSISCGPKEGKGFLYSLKLATGAPARNYNTTDAANPDGSGTTDDDRDKELDTPGIPAQVVYLGSPSTTGGGSSCVVNILAGAQVFEAPGCPRFRTFWQRFEN